MPRKFNRIAFLEPLFGTQTSAPARDRGRPFWVASKSVAICLKFSVHRVNQGNTREAIQHIVTTAISNIVLFLDGAPRNVAAAAHGRVS